MSLKYELLALTESVQQLAVPCHGAMSLKSGGLALNEFDLALAVPCHGAMSLKSMEAELLLPSLSSCSPLPRGDVAEIKDWQSKVRA